MAETYGPYPQNAVNSASGGGVSIFEKVIDFGTGILTRAAAVELERYELSRLGELRAAEAVANNQRQQELSGVGDFTAREKTIIGVSSALSIAMLGAAAFLIARR